MGKMKKTSAAQADLDSPVSASNWTDRAVAYVKAHGGEGFVIRAFDTPHAGQTTPAQWVAWLAYLTRLGVKTVFMREHRLATVPTEWPEEFDPAAPISDRSWTPPLFEQRRVPEFKPRRFPDDHRAPTPLDHLRAPARPPLDLNAPLAVSDELRRRNQQDAEIPFDR